MMLEASYNLMCVRKFSEKKQLC